MKSDSKAGELSVLLFDKQDDWAKWLAGHHAASPGVWLRLAKKGAGLRSVKYAEAVETALCYGWIDGQAKSENETTYLQRFTPRTKKSVWSKLNREKALALIESGRMQPAGLTEIERANADGRWEAAYDAPSSSTVPPDLQEALDSNPRAKAFFSTLSGTNRYAILFRIQTARKAETRAKRVQKFTEMLERHEKLYP
jgi:uncharacterized protein YdeI (YjbR/CyaY-like superfamily)